MKFKDTLIQRRLMIIVMLTCSVVVALMCSAYIVLEYITFKETVKRNVSTLALVIASNSSAALAFGSQKDGNETLDALRADKHIEAAGLYDKNGQLFAKYPISISDSNLPVRPEEPGHYFESSFLSVFIPVVQKNHRLGTLYIKSNLNAVYVQMRRNALIAVFLLAAALIIAYFLSRILQRSISQPIVGLEKTAKAISQQNDYSVRAVKTADDEIGSLTDAFNHMLSQIEKRNLEIKRATEESSKLAAIVASSGDAIIGSSLDLAITSWNNSATRILGYDAEEIMGQPIFNMVLKEGQQKIDTVISQLKEGGQIDSFETQFITRQQVVLDISLTISPVKNSLGEIIGFSQVARDISRQKQNERLIKQNEEHLRLATQAAELGTFDWDLANGTIEWDARCRELFGIENNEVITTELLLDGLHPDDKERVTRMIQRAFDKASGGNYDTEYRVITRASKLRWIRAMGKAFFDDNDIPVRFIGTALDITNKKHEEIKRNEFISIVSHELKTPLTSIKSYVQILLAKAKKEGDDFSVNALSRTEVQTNKMTSMIKDFLSLARIEEGKIQIVKEEFNIHGLMRDIADEILFLNSGYKIILKDCDEIKIYADREKIGQVLSNLLSNAVKYSAPGSKVVMGCDYENGKVNIYVSDEGVGITYTNVSKLFSRFYRVENEKIKNVSGFGIGLYIASEILRYHNSRIEVKSTEGKGSTFSFYMDTV